MPSQFNMNSCMLSNGSAKTQHKQVGGHVGHAIWDVTRAILVSQLQHTSPAWSGFLSAAKCSRLQAIINKAVRYGLLPTHTLSLTDLFYSQPTNLSFNQSSVIHTTFFINYSHLLKTQTILYDLNHINIIYCKPYPPPAQKRVSLT